MIGVGLSIVQLAVRQLLGGTFSPIDLFTTGVNGAWYDPSDYGTTGTGGVGTLFQNAAGTTPVTAVEQPVGLMLDKSKGLVLGPELVTNGAFDSNISGWTRTTTGVTISWDTGNLKIVYVSGLVAGATAPISVISGKTYKITGDLTVTGSGSGSIQLFASATPSDWSSGQLATSSIPNAGTGKTSVSLIYTATSTTTLYVGSGFRGTPTAGATILADNISVRELPGNHAFNSSGNSANFPVLSARYNLLTKTEQFDDAVWGKSGTSISSNTSDTTDPIGGNTANKITATATSANIAYTKATLGTLVVGFYTLSWYLKKGTANWNFVQLSDQSANAAGSWFDVTGSSGETGATSSAGANVVLTSKSIQYVSNDWFRCTITVEIKAATTYAFQIYLADANNSLSVTVGKTAYIWGADLRVANDAMNQPAYQRVNTSTDYDTVGFKPYLRFNGTNQWLQTNSIDFSYGDKMFFSAGVRKLSDAAVGTIVETSTSSGVVNGTFMLTSAGQASVGAKYGSTLRGTALIYSDTAASYTAPLTSVVSLVNDIAQSTAATEQVMRINGSAATLTTVGTDAGTGNFTSQPLFIGARNASSFWFNGRLYGLVVAGKQASAAEITSTETYLNQKTGAF